MFERAVVPHLRAAHQLARWLLAGDDAAQDAVQEAYLRAYRHFDGFNGENPRAWLLAIVRNCCFRALQKRPAGSDPLPDDLSADGADPEHEAVRKDLSRAINRAVAALRPEQREVFVLRELEGLSYKDIAVVIAAPIGTVMSRLSRARAELQAALAGQEGA